MLQAVAPGRTASAALIARMDPPEPSVLARILANLRQWREAFAEAQDMRREAAAHYPFIDS